MTTGLAVTSASGQELSWSRKTVDLLDPQTPFIIVSTGSFSEQLSAGALYRYVNKKEPVVLKGRKDSHGEFWPSVCYEVGVEGRKKWKLISSFTEPEIPATMRFDAENAKGLLQIDMEPFRASIGKFRWGRVSLPNGDAAEFLLDNLLPTPSARDASGDFKKDVSDPDPARLGSLFALVSLTSISNHLVGDFVFWTGEQTFAEVKGSKTADGDFWPAVILQCGNEDGAWQTVGRSDNYGTHEVVLRLSSRGSLPPLRVRLDAYRGCQGRFKYARVIFADEEIAAVFQIADLQP